MLIRKLLFVWALAVSAGFGDEVDWKRPVIIGASLADGFYLPEMGIPFVSPISKELGLHHHFDQAVATEHGRFRNLGSKWFFLAAEPHGANQISKARQLEPSVVIAVDYLFWYLSAESKHRGRKFREMTRLQLLEKGLGHLATLKCPLVVGNIPDAKSSVGRVLSREQYAGTEIVKKANVRIRAWAKEHPNVRVMDLHRFHRQASNNLEMKVGDKIIPAGESRKLFLQWDQIHPTLEGARAVAAEAVRALEGKTLDGD